MFFSSIFSYSTTLCRAFFVTVFVFLPSLTVQFCVCNVVRFIYLLMWGREKRRERERERVERRERKG